MNSGNSGNAEQSMPSGQLREAIAQLMHCAADRRFEQALYWLDWIFDCRGRVHSLATLKKIASGALPIERLGSFYVPAGSLLPLPLVSQLQDALSRCSVFLALPAPTLLVDGSSPDEQLHLTFENFPGFAIVRFSSADPRYPEAMRGVVVHEVAHAFLSCGVRLLDEGFATFVASRLGEQPPDDIQLPQYSLRALLSPAANSAVAFEAVIGAREAPSVYAYGARIIGSLHDARGMGAVRRLFRDVQLASDVEELLALVSVAVREGGDTAPAPGVRPTSPSPDSIGTRRLIFEAHDRQDAEVLTAPIAELERQLGEGDFGILDLLLCARLAAANLAYVGGRHDPANIERIDLLVAEASGRLASARLWAIRGHRAMLALKLDRKNILKVATAYRRAVFAYERALELCPSDSDAVLGRALLHLHTPRRYGGDRAAGLRMLHGLLSDELYAQHVRRLIDSFEVESEEARTTQPQPSSGADRPALLRARGISLRLSDTFKLELNELEVGTGERVGLVGANGSGKTVLVESLLGLRRLDAGEIQIFGRPVREALDAQTKRELGALIQMSTLPAAMYVHEIVRLHDGLYGTHHFEVGEALGLTELRGMQFKDLSRGQARRVQLFLALAHVPQLAVLDEPTLGVDEHYATSLRRLWRDSRQGLLIVSHNPGDLEAMDRLVWLEDGLVRDDGTLAALMHKHVGQVKCQILDRHQTREWDVGSIAGVKSIRRDAQGRVVLFGSDRLAADFPGFVYARGIQAFSMERASTSDLLSVITGEGDA